MYDLFVAKDVYTYLQCILNALSLSISVVYLMSLSHIQPSQAQVCNICVCSSLLTDEVVIYYKFITFSSILAAACASITTRVLNLIPRPDLDFDLP